MWSPEVVPWWIIHPQYNHQTFWPAWNVYPTNDCCDVLLLWHFTTATLQPCNVLLLWHFDPIMFYFCDISTPIWYIQKLTSTLLQRWTSCHCVRTSTFFFYLDCIWRPLFLWSKMWTPGSVLASLVGGGRYVTMVEIKAWLLHLLAHGSDGRVP